MSHGFVYLVLTSAYPARCRYEHPRDEHSFQPQNRFSALQGDNRPKAANAGMAHRFPSVER